MLRLAAAQPPRRENRSHAQAQPRMARTAPERPQRGAGGGVERPRGTASRTVPPLARRAVIFVVTVEDAD